METLFCFFWLEGNKAENWTRNLIWMEQEREEMNKKSKLDPNWIVEKKFKKTFWKGVDTENTGSRTKNYFHRDENNIKNSFHSKVMINEIPIIKSS